MFWSQTKDKIFQIKKLKIVKSGWMDACWKLKESSRSETSSKQFQCNLKPGQRKQFYCVDMIWIFSWLMLLWLRSTSTRILSPLKAFSFIVLIPQLRSDIFCRLGRFLMKMFSPRLEMMLWSMIRTWTSMWRLWGMELSLALVQLATFLPLLHLHSQPRQWLSQSE